MKNLFLERFYKNCPRMLQALKCDFLLPYNADKIKSAINLLAYRHPFLTATLNSMDDSFAYNLDKRITPLVIESASVFDFEKDFTQFENEVINYDSESLCRFYLYKNESSFSMLFIVHKILADQKGLMTLVQDFVLAYQDLLAEKVVVPRFVENLKNLPQENFFSLKERRIIKRANNYVKKRKISLDSSRYKEYHNSVIQNNPIGFAYRKLPLSFIETIQSECVQNNISLPAYFSALLCKNFFIPFFLFSVDIRESLYWYIDGSLGNFSSFILFNSKNYSKKNFFEFARDIERQLMLIKYNKKSQCSAIAKILALEPCLIDLIFPSLEYFSSDRILQKINKLLKIKKNLEYIISDVGNYSIPEIKNVVFLESPFPVTSLSFTLLTVNDELQISCRYQKKDYSQEKFAKYLDDMIHSV